MYHFITKLIFALVFKILVIIIDTIPNLIKTIQFILQNARIFNVQNLYKSLLSYFFHLEFLAFIIFRFTLNFILKLWDTLLLIISHSLQL